MNYAGKFDAKLSADGSGLHSNGHGHVETVHAAHVPSGAIVVPDAQLLFNGDFKRSGVDLILSRDHHELVLHDYFKGEKRAALSSPDGAHLNGDVVNALAGNVQYAQADGSAAAGHVIGHVTKLTGAATAIRNGVSIILNNGDNVEKGDVVQSGSDSTLGITFIDGTVFGLSSNARMVLNEMVYDPNGSSNSSLLSLVSGTITFVAGETAKHGDMKIDTPVATMGIRGTAVLFAVHFKLPNGVLLPDGQDPPPDAIPEGEFQVLVEPDGTSGSYILFEKTTLTPFVIVDKPGVQINITSGNVTQSLSQLSPEVQKLITDVFTLKFSDSSNTKTLDHFTDSIVPQTLGPIQLAFGPPVTPMVLLVNTQTGASGNSGNASSDIGHIGGPPKTTLVPATGFTVSELTGKTGDTADFDTFSGKIKFVDVNLGDRPTVSSKFDSFSYTDGHGNVVSLNALQKADVAALDLNLFTLKPDPNNANTGTVTWTYNDPTNPLSLPDSAFDFLAAGETLKLTYLVTVDNNFAPADEKTTVPITITITGTNDVPVINTGPQTIGFAAGTSTKGGDLGPSSSSSGVVLNQSTSPAGALTATEKGTLTFTDPDLTDTHSLVLTSPTGDLTGASLSGTTLNLVALESQFPGPFQIFENAFSASLATDSTGTGTGTINWTLGELPVYVGDFIPVGETLTLTYTVEVKDSQGAIATQNVTVNITGTDKPAEVWIASVPPGATPGGLWSNASNWETGNVPVATDDVIIITNQLLGLTPSYPATIDAATNAVAETVTLNDFSDLGNAHPELINQGKLTIGGTFDVGADSTVENFGTITVGGPMEVSNTSVLQNYSQLTLQDGGGFKDQTSIANSGTIELSGGTLDVEVAVANASGIIKVDGPATMQLNGAAINGGTLGNSGTLDSIGTSALTNVGITNSGLIESTAGTLTIDPVAGPTLTNSGTLEANGGELDITSDPVANTGTLQAIDDSTLKLTTLTVTNTGGTVTVGNGSTLDLVSATVSGGTLGNSGTLNSTGTSALTNVGITNSGLIESTAGTLTIDPPVPGPTLTNSGTLEANGGELDITSNPIANTGTLQAIDDSTLKLTTLTVTNTGGTVTVGNGSTLDLASATISGGTLGNSGTLDSIGTSALTNVGITNSGLIESTAGTLTIDPPVPGPTLTNSGTLEANGGELDITSNPIANTGTLQAIDDSTLKLTTLTVTNTGGTVTVGNGSTLDMASATIDGGTITDNGTIDVTGNSSINGVTAGTPATTVNAILNGGGAVTIESGVTLTLDNVTVNGTVFNDLVTGGTIQIDNGDALAFNGATINGGTLDVLGVMDSTGTSLISDATIINAGNIVVVSGVLTIDPTPVTNTGTMEVMGGSTLVLSDDIITNTKGIIQVDTESGHATTLDLEGSTISGGTLNISGELDSSGDSFLTGVTITNSGTIDVTSGTLIIDATSTLNNTGKLESDGGNLIIDTSFSGSLEIKGGAVLELGAYSPYASVTVTFDPDATGTLKLDHAATFAGTVVGLDDNKIDLVDIKSDLHGATVLPTVSFDSATDVLTITSGVDPTEVAHIQLQGDYTGVTWNVTTDGNGGTDVNEIPGVITGLINGNASEGSPIKASITDGGAAVTATYTWQISENGKWVAGSGVADLNGNYTPGETDEGHALQVVISYVDSLHHSETAIVSAGTVIGTADVPVVSTPDAITTNEDVPTTLTGLSVSTTDGGADDADTFTATVYVEHGNLTLGSGAFSVTASGDGHDSNHALTITGTLADVNAALAAITYTPTGEYEGTDTVHFTALSTEEAAVGGNVSPTATPVTSTITVAGVADTPILHASASAGTTTENTATLLSGLSVSTADGGNDAADTFTATVYVDHGKLTLGNGLHATISGGAGDNSADAVVITGSLTDVNAALAAITYTPTGEYEGTDTVHFTALSTEEAAVGGNVSPTATPVTSTITVAGVADTPILHASASAGTTTENTATLLTGLSVSTTDGGNDDADTFTATVYVDHGKLTLGNGLHATISGGAGDNSADAVVITGSLTDVNAALAAITYTPTGEYEGTDTVHFTALSTEEAAVGGNVSPTATPVTSTITVAGVADTPILHASASAGTTTENTATLLSGLSVSTADGGNDAADTFTATVYVDHGKLTLGSGAFSVTASGDGHDSNHALTITGTLADVNAALLAVTYTPTGEYEGTDTVHFTALSTEEAAVGGNVSPTATPVTSTITVNPVADIPVITASAAPIVEDGTSALTLTLTNAADLFENSDDSVTITVTLNQGATLHGTGVTNNHNGTFTLTAHSASDLNGLTITPAGEFNGAVTVGVSAVTHDGTAISSAGTASTTLTVGPMVTVSAAATSVNEGGTVGLIINAAFGDGDETDSVVITGVPTTAALSAGTNHGGGSWTLTPGQLAGLKLIAGDDDVTSITLQVTAKATEDGNTASSATQNITIAENPVAEAPSLAGTPTTIFLTKHTGPGNGSADFTIKDALSETDADSFLSTITISNVPDGVSFNHGSAGPNGTWTLNPASDLTGLKIIYPDGTLHFTLSVVGTTNDGGNIASSAAKSIAVNIAPAGEAGHPINLALTGTLADGPGDPITVTITGVPTDWSLNGGTDLGNGAWTVQTTDPSALTITTAANFVGAVQLGVTETSILADGTISSYSFGDNLEAYSPGSPIFALAGDDHLSGAGANDLFVFSQPIGVDVVYNFNAASDKIDMVGFNNVRSFADIQANLTDDANGNAVITLGPGETITLQGVHAAALNASDFVFDQTPVTTNAGSMTIGDGATLPLSGTINNTGTIALNSTSTETDLQIIEHGLTLMGGGHVTLSDNDLNVISGTSSGVTLNNQDNTISGAGQLGNGELSLINSGTIDATGTHALVIDTGSNIVLNSGILEASASGGMTIASAVANSGILWAHGADLTVQGAVSGDGIAKIDGSGILDFESSSTANVVFDGSGELILKDPAHFTGTISDSGGSMTAADVIDVAGFDASASVSYSGTTSSGIVTISEAGHAAVQLNVGANSGNWSAPVTDGNGGIVIHDPPADTSAALGGVVMQDPGPAATSTIVASAPNQTLSGLAASDTFVFNFAAIGQDTVTNFHPATDALQFSGTIFANAQAALNAAQDDGHGNTVVALDAHDTITLSGVLKAQLHVSDFHVV